MTDDGRITAVRAAAPTPAEIDAILRAGASAPSSHNSQPWRLRWRDGAVEVHGDTERRLPATDPDARELRLACGAALANIRLTVRAQGRRAHTRLLPDPAEPWFLGRVRPGGPLPPSAWESELAAAVPRRRTDRHPFTGPPPSAELRDRLARAAWREGCRLVLVTDRQRRRGLRDLTAEAHRRQRADPAFTAEWDRWIGHGERVDDGLPPDHVRRAPRPDAGWRPRDFGGGVDEADRVTAVEDHAEEEPTIAVVATYDDGALAHVRAGQAMEQVLLTATAHGVGASFVAPPLEIAAVRAQVRGLLGGVLWPQVVLRLGRGRAVPPTPRRADAST